MLRTPQSQEVPPASRTAFTLVEMLISVALVLLMMTMFAQVFQMAGSSISTQRGLAENDQRSRMLQTIIKADFDNRTFLTVMPFAPGELITEPLGREGYFYISENSSLSGVDDVLQFTVATTPADPYYGKALSFPSTDTASPPNLDFSTNPFIKYPNQPDVDDSQTVPNNTGLSIKAEVAYFVRNGNLYRRQLLVRKPPSIPGIKTQPDTGNASNSGVDLFTLSTAPGYNFLLGQGYAKSFWNDFDYSAFFSGSGAVFLGEDSLKNDGSSIAVLANPRVRFGHDYNSGNPKEFLAYGNAPWTAFVGRYTLEECSHGGFQYPQSAAVPYPMDPAFPGVGSPIGIGGDGAVSGFRGGLRRGEDLLLSNVHSFDVQVLDESAGQFVNLAGASAVDFSSSSAYQLNTLYGPNPTANAVFDTWHPRLDLDGNAVADNPPFFPQKNVPGVSTTVGYWTASKSYAIGDKVFPSTASGIAPYFYQCIDTVGTGTSGTTQPTWPVKVGGEVTDNAQVRWRTMDNRRPLKAIKIEIRFLDTSTQQMRQLTLINSLAN